MKRALALLILAAPLLSAGQLWGQTSAPAVNEAEAPAFTGALDPELVQDLHFRSVGPSRGGRVTAVAGHPSHPATFYMGSTGGGVWRTDDYGTTWTNLSDGFFDTPAIGAIRVAPSDPNIIYVGTGSDGIRSNVITGKGVYRSDDAGETWRFIGLPEAGQIGRMAVHPHDPDRLYVAAIGNAFGRSAERGLYRTRDGGESWDRVFFHSDSVGVYGLQLQPGNPDVIYMTTWRAERKPWTIISGMEAAGGGGIYRSRDGGETWTQLSSGLPQGLIGKIDLAISPAVPRRIYALVEAPGEEQGLYRSDDAGDSWELINTEPGLTTRPFYFTNVHVDPVDPDIVYVGAVRFWKSTDGGRSFSQFSTPHADNHDMWINPDDSDLYIQANDGGATVTRDGGETWSTQHNQSTAELYQVRVDSRFPYWLYAGQQDNTTIMVPSRPPETSAPAGQTALWRAVGGCETGPATPKPGDPTIVFANCKGRFGRFSHATGQEKQYYVGAANMYGTNPAELEYRFQRTVPVEVSPHDPNTVYHASQYLHRTIDEGVTWERISPDLTAFRPERQVISGGPINRDITGEEHYSTIYAVRESPLEPGLIWVGANDGPVHVTRDGGENWTDVTPADMPPEGRIQSIEPSPHDPAKAYIAGYRYMLDDWQPYIYRTTDYGRSWTRLTDGTNGIPADYPTRVVREDPDRVGLLYAGTEFGLYISFNDGADWQPFQLNLPVTPVTDIRVHESDLVLSTMGRGFWILDDLSPLHALDDRLADADLHLFEPRPAHRMSYSTRRDESDPSDPEYPSPGATIHYIVDEDALDEITLEIRTADGDPIREFSGERLADGDGLHRFRWDLRHPGAWMEDDRSRPGPLAVPGEYQLRLSAGDRSVTAPLTVLIDPRVAADGVTRADLEEQLALSLEIRDALSQARQAAARIDDALEQLASAENTAGTDSDRGDAAVELKALRARLVTAEGAYMQPMLIDQISYLYSMLDSADQKPGRDASERLETLRSELDDVLQRLETLLPT